MKIQSFTAKAHPNIALIKYWGNRDNSLRLPSSGSISMNLGNIYTITTVTIKPGLEQDQLILNGELQLGPPLERLHQYLEKLRKLFKRDQFLDIKSSNNFPTAAGIASSASAFAALAAAVANIYQINITRDELSALARLGSGSACRSVPGGFTEWKVGNKHEDSFAISIASVEHWDLWDCITILQSGPKDVSSTQGHHLAHTSPLQNARIEDAPRRLEICRKAIIDKDFGSLAEIIELDSNMMHAVMMTSQPSIIYWRPISIQVMQEVTKFRQKGIAAAYTLDAGPNVHVICEGKDVKRVESLLLEMKGVEKIIKSPVGNGVSLIQND